MQFLDKLKANSSNLDSMSATVENPSSIPLMQINGTQGNPTADAEKGEPLKGAKAKKKWSKYVADVTTRENANTIWSVYVETEVTDSWQLVGLSRLGTRM